MACRSDAVPRTHSWNAPHAQAPANVTADRHLSSSYAAGPLNFTGNTITSNVSKCPGERFGKCRTRVRVIADIRHNRRATYTGGYVFSDDDTRERAAAAAAADDFDGAGWAFRLIRKCECMLLLLSRWRWCARQKSKPEHNKTIEHGLCESRSIITVRFAVFVWPPPRSWKLWEPFGSFGSPCETSYVRSVESRSRQKYYRSTVFDVIFSRTLFDRAELRCNCTRAICWRIRSWKLFYVKLCRRQ